MSKFSDTHFVYMLSCNNGNYYTGFTTDLVRRYQEHLSGSAKCKYTRSFKPLYLAQSWQIADKSTALKIERYIKSLNKQQKLKLLKRPEQLVRRFRFLCRNNFNLARACL